MNWMKLIALVLQILMQLPLTRDQRQALFPFHAKGETPAKRKLAESIRDAWRDSAHLNAGARRAAVQSLVDQYIAENPNYMADLPPEPGINAAAQAEADAIAAQQPDPAGANNLPDTPHTNLVPPEVDERSIVESAEARELAELEKLTDPDAK